MPDFAALTTRIRAAMPADDRAVVWPVAALDVLRESGALRWVIPASYGGEALDGVDQLRAYEATARGSVTAALVLTQRDGACDLIAHSDNDVLKERLLPEYAVGRRFTSVGISQLTTSKGADGKPHMLARRDGRDFVLTGAMPWVTGAAYCNEIVTGGVLPDGLQVLLVAPADASGVEIQPPFDLLALASSFTARVACREMRVSAANVVAGPMDVALRMRAPVKPLVVSSVGLGLLAGMFDEVDERIAQEPAALRELVETLRARVAAVRERLYEAAGRVGHEPDYSAPAAAIRVEVNELLSRTSAALMTVFKGRGFVPPHPAQRLAREALFFHVWSASEDVSINTLRVLVE